MATFENFYEPERAAGFLKITLLELCNLTLKGSIKLHKFKGREYYLGGELDSLKSTVRQKPIALLGNSPSCMD